MTRLEGAPVDDGLELRLRGWMSTSAPAREPEGLVARVDARTATLGQRPALLVRTGLGGGGLAGWTQESPGRRLVALGLMALLLLAFAGALMATLARPEALVEPRPSALPAPSAVPAPSAAPRAIVPPAGGLDTPRDSAAAVLLGSGQVLVVGGSGDIAGRQQTLRLTELYDPASGHFLVNSAMTTPRIEPLVTRLDDGRVLIVGGRNDDEDLASAEVYEPETQTFTTVGPMRSARGSCHCGVAYLVMVRPTLTTLTDGRVMIAGGRFDGSFEGEPPFDADRADLFDPATDQFTSSAPFPCDVTRGTLTGLRDGTVLVTCRAFGATPDAWQALAFRYDPATDTFTSTGAPTTDDTGQATLLPDGTVLLTGPGLRASSAPAEIYDPATGTFAPVDDGPDLFGDDVNASPFSLRLATATGPVLFLDRDAGHSLVYDPTRQHFTPYSLPWPLGAGVAVDLADGHALVIPGTTAPDAAPDPQIIDIPDPSELPATSWPTSPIATPVPSLGAADVELGVQAASLTTIARIPIEAASSRVVPIDDDRLLLIGPSPTMVDLSTGRARSVGPGDPDAGVPQVARLADGRVFVVGWAYGEDSIAGGSVAQLYDPGRDAFVPAGAMTTPRFEPGVVGLGDGRVLIAGGYVDVDGSPQRSAEIYDPATGVFTATGPMRTARSHPQLTLLEDGRVLVVGGCDGVCAVDSAELFDPASGRFEATGEMVGRASAFRGRTVADIPPIRLPDGRVLVFGVQGSPQMCGLHGIDPVAAELYDPVTGTFSVAPPVPHAISTAALLPDGRVLLTGQWQAIPGGCGSGARSQTDAWIGVYDPATGNVHESRDPISGGSSLGVDTDRGYAASVALDDGRVLLVESDAPVSDEPPSADGLAIDAFDLGPLTEPSPQP